MNNICSFKISIIICLAILGTITDVISQEAQKNFLAKKNQHSISFKPLAISYDYTYIFAKKSGFGIRIESGFGLRYIPQPQLNPLDIHIVDNLNLQLQYRLLFPLNFILIWDLKLHLEQWMVSMKSLVSIMVLEYPVSYI